MLLRTALSEAPNIVRRGRYLLCLTKPWSITKARNDLSIGARWRWHSYCKGPVGLVGRGRLPNPFVLSQVLLILMDCLIERKRCVH